MTLFCSSFTNSLPCGGNIFVSCCAMYPTSCARPRVHRERPLCCQVQFKTFSTPRRATTVERERAASRAHKDHPLQLNLTNVAWKRKFIKVRWKARSRFNCLAAGAALFNFLMIYITSRFLITTEAPSFYQAPSQRQIQLGSPTFKVQLAKRSAAAAARAHWEHPHFYVPNA